MTDLKGKTLFITGATRGIGYAIAERAAKDGANIAIIAKTTKGKGVKFMEDNNDWHHNRLTEKLFHEAMNEM